MEKLFLDKGFKSPVKLKAGIYNILLYSKILKHDPALLTNGEKFIAGIGTFVYKKNTPSRSLEIFFEDLEKDTFDPDQLIGTFWIIYFDGLKLSYLTDRTGIQNIYYSFDKNVISSSFLAVAYSFKEQLNLNKNAVTELLTTGSLIGPETLFNEVYRLESYSKVVIRGMEKINISQKDTSSEFNGSYKASVDSQIKVLDDYFDSIRSLADEVGVDSGITGGHDSRLIMALGLKHFNNISFNTHWRNSKSIEMDSAINVCNSVNADLAQIKVKDSIQMSGEELEDNLNRAFLFFDGLPRMHSFWTEEYNTKEYRINVLRGKQLGLSGIGGEQYRNEERFNRNKWDVKDTVKYKIILNQCGDCFKSGKELDSFIDHIENKIVNALDLNRRYFTRKDYKRYLNEVFIPARLGVRNNAENQLSYFLSPFTDHTVSLSAYSIANKLGPSLQFEEDMIKNINPSLARVESDLGFDFFQGEPFTLKVKSFILDFLPRGLLYSKYSKKINNLKTKEDFDNLVAKSNLLKEGVGIIENLDLPIKINDLKYKPDLMPVLLALGYLLKTINPKLG